MADAFELDDVRAHALTNLSIAKQSVGDTSGDDDLARSIEISRSANSIELGRGLNNLAMRALEKGDLIRSVELLDEAIEVDERLGSSTYSKFARGGRIPRLVELGRWDEAMAGADSFIAECEIEPHYQEVTVRVARSNVSLARGDLVGAERGREGRPGVGTAGEGSAGDRAGHRESNRRGGDSRSP